MPIYVRETLKTYVNFAKRYRCIYAENSRDKLKLTRESLCQIMSYYQVMPVYLDFMLVFGSKSDARDLRFSGFRDQIQLKPSASGHHGIPELGRSGRIFQLCYNLKSVHLEKRGSEQPEPTDWSIRDAAFYHQFDVEYGTTLWIVTKGGLDVLDRYQELVGPSVRPGQGTYDDLASCFRSTLATHLLYCHWSTEDWRWYIVWLEEIVDKEVCVVVMILREVADSKLHRAAWPSTVPAAMATHTKIMSPETYNTYSTGKTRLMRSLWFFRQMPKSYGHCGSSTRTSSCGKTFRLLYEMRVKMNLSRSFRSSIASSTILRCKSLERDCW